MLRLPDKKRFRIFFFGRFLQGSMMELTSPSPEDQQRSNRVVIAGILVIICCYALWQLGGMPGVGLAAAAEGMHETAAAEVHEAPPAAPAYYSVLPFVLLLLSIALFPLMRITSHWWERNWNRFFVALGLGAVTLLYYAVAYGAGVADHATHAMSAPGVSAAVTVLKNAVVWEYAPFMLLLFSLYVISGGIVIEGRLVGRPVMNSGLLAISGILASFIGTTGAAMLMIRPLLRANAQRRYVAHTMIFFTFIACNTGGCLTPLGDPPLFLGYLRGVDFLWTLKLFPEWLFMNGCLLAVYFLWDTIRHRHEDRAALEANSNDNEPFAIRGAINFVWLLGVIACVAFLDPSKPIPGIGKNAPAYFREMAMLAMTALSLWTTAALVRRKNSFNYDAILEVAALFIGIFICMQAPIQILHVKGPELGFDAPWKFYWGSGSLSSFLDNAPTYVVFFETAKSLDVPGAEMAGVNEIYLAAISLGSVFMGAMTYIGNGPNFMVKAIAEKNNVRMPSFFGYMAYSCCVLLPLSFLMTLLFL